MAPERKSLDIIWLKSATSTNYELRQRKDSLDNLSIIAAVEQTKGRGQGTHSWFSSPDTNLTFSILMRFPAEGSFSVDSSEMLLITEVSSLAVRDYLLDKAIEARIKWPNDIWVADKKICGILIENILDGKHIRESIVGIGLNVNEENWPPELPNPVSMRELTSERYELEKELPLLREKICRRFEQLGSQDGRMNLDSEFGKLMFKLHEEQR